MLVTPIFKAVGSLLDEWTNIAYDIETKVHSLNIFHPVGDIIIRKREKLVNVEELEF